MVLAMEVIVLRVVLLFLSLGSVLGLGHPHANARHNRKKMVEDKEHLKEDLEDRFSKEAVENMTDEEKDYHYFRLHDFDKNDMLDGLEVLKAVNHVIEHDEEGKEVNANAENLKVKQFNLLVEMIDKVRIFLFENVLSFDCRCWSWTIPTRMGCCPTVSLWPGGGGGRPRIAGGTACKEQVSKG